MHFETIISFISISSLSMRFNDANDLNPNCECGKSKIVQSAVDVPTVANEFPWQVFIRVIHNPQLYNLKDTRVVCRPQISIKGDFLRQKVERYPFLCLVFAFLCPCTLPRSAMQPSSSNRRNALLGNRSVGDMPLRGRFWEDGFHDCGGTIINDLFILTSSSCILKFRANTFGANPELIAPSKVFVFPKMIAKNVDGRMPSDNTKYWTVKKIIHHSQLPCQPEDDDHVEGKEFDIALIKLHKRLQFQNNDEIRPICLPLEDNFNIYNWNSVYKLIVGWISKPSNDKKVKGVTTNLHKLKAGVVYDRCENVFGERHADESYVCSTQQAEFMDVGSPMIAYANNFAIQLGILSSIIPQHEHEMNQNCSLGQAQLEKDIPFGLFTKLSSRDFGKPILLLLLLITKALQMFIKNHTTEEGALWCANPTNYLLKKQPKTEKVYSEPWKSAANKIPQKEIDCLCGQRKATARIVGGENAAPYEFPWLVLVNRERKNRFPSRCGASIINDHMLLTAAHCVTTFFGDNRNEVNVPRPPGPYSVYLHFHNISEIKNNPNHEFKRFSVDRIIVHPDFFIAKYLDDADFPTDEDDIALLVLSEKIDIKDPRFTPVCLPKDGEILRLSGKQAIMAGWGTINRVQHFPSLIPSDVPKKIVVPIHSDADCDKYSPKVNPNLFFCADPFHPNGSNRGDSGGPLIIEMETNEYIQVGVVSHGTSFTDSDREEDRNTVTLYSRVTAYVDWIYYHAALRGAHWCRRASNPS